MTQRRFPNRKVWLARLLLILALANMTGALTSCSRTRSATPASAPRVDGDTITFAPTAPQLRALRTEPATSGQPVAIVLTGRLGWNEDATARIVPPVAGRVVRLRAAVGNPVTAGELLAEISSPDFGQARADTIRAATDLAAAERTRDRLSRLFERGAVPRKDLDGAESDLARTSAEAGRTRERLRRWGGDPATRAAGFDQIYHLRSPLAGVIVERNVNPAQEVRPDSPLPLFVVSDPSRLWVYLDVSEKGLAGLVKGDRLSIRTSAYPELDFPGRLEVVGDSLDSATRTVKARGSVANGKHLLKSEMYVTVEDHGTRTELTSVVPARSVLTEGSRRYCFVREGLARFRRVTIDVGPERGGKVSVISGLPAGAEVVTDGSLLLAALMSSRG